MRTLPLLALLLCACATTPNAPAEDPRDAELFARLEAEVDAFAQRHQLPGMMCGVVRDGRLIWERGYAPGADQPTRDTVFRIGSITKVMTAQAILMLRDGGRLTLDDPVSMHIPELREALDNDGSPVRIRHLVQHSSGIPTLGDGTLDWTTDANITPEKLIASVRNCKLNFAPGTDFQYSNVGVALGGIIVARAGGRPYRDFMNERYFATLGMQDTGWDRPAEGVWPGHVRRDGAWVQPERYWVLGAIEPSGGVYSTLADMAKFTAYQLAPANSPLRAESVRESQAIEAERGVGIGWFATKAGGLGRVVWHNGATFAYSALVMLAPDAGHGVIVLVATGDGKVVGDTDRLGVSLLRLMAGLEPVAPPLAGGTPAALVETVVARAKAALADPRGHELAETFSGEFIEAIGEKELRDFLAGVHRFAGAWKEFAVVEDLAPGHFRLKVEGEKAKLSVEISADTEAPHLIDSIAIQPAE